MNKCYLHIGKIGRLLCQFFTQSILQFFQWRSLWLRTAHGMCRFGSSGSKISERLWTPCSSHRIWDLAFHSVWRLRTFALLVEGDTTSYMSRHVINVFSEDWLMSWKQPATSNSARHRRLNVLTTEQLSEDSWLFKEHGTPISHLLGDLQTLSLCIDSLRWNSRWSCCVWLNSFNLC